MVSKKGIIIRNENTPTVHRDEINSIVDNLETKSFETIFCNTNLEAIDLIKERHDEILFIYLTNPIHNLEESTKEFIDFVNNNENYNHIQLFVRFPKEDNKNKYDWYDDFINFIKL